MILVPGDIILTGTPQGVVLSYPVDEEAGWRMAIKSPFKLKNWVPLYKLVILELKWFTINE
jgi:hypothetical protein